MNTLDMTENDFIGFVRLSRNDEVIAYMKKYLYFKYDEKESQENFEKQQNKWFGENGVKPCCRIAEDEIPSHTEMQPQWSVLCGWSEPEETQMYRCKTCGTVKNYFHQHLEG